MIYKSILTSHRGLGRGGRPRVQSSGSDPFTPAGWRGFGVGKQMYETDPPHLDEVRTWVLGLISEAATKNPRGCQSRKGALDRGPEMVGSHEAAGSMRLPAQFLCVSVCVSVCVCVSEVSCLVGTGRETWASLPPP